MEEFINLHQGGMSVQGYSIKFTKFSKYVSCLMTNPRDEISHFVTGMPDDLMEEGMLHNDMDLSRFMVHA